MTKKERKAIYAVETQNLRLAHHLEGALRMLKDNLAALPDGAAGLIGKAETVLVGQDDRGGTLGNYAMRLAELENENASLRMALQTNQDALRRTVDRISGYDWNADPDHITLAQSAAFTAAEKLQQ
jgi:hypothetical protein